MTEKTEIPEDSEEKKKADLERAQKAAPPAGDGNNDGKKDLVGQQTAEQRIKELETAFKVVEKEFVFTKNELITQVDNWKTICVWSIVICILLSVWLLNITFPPDWTWQYVYYTTIRVLISGVVISLLTFCFKMLRSYLHLLEQIRHKLTVIRSMANLVGSGTSETQRDYIYLILNEMIIRLGNIGIIGSEDDFKQPSILDVLEKLTKKKE